jgi:hypothetical protein
MILCLIANAIAMTARAELITDVDPVGPHHRLFRFDKNENSQNVMYAFTRASAECRFERKNGKPLVDFYWLMEGSRFKSPHPLVESGIARRLKFSDLESTASGEIDAFSARIEPSKAERSKIEDAIIRVTSLKTSAGCRVTTSVSYLSPEGEKKAMELKSIKAETRKTWIPPFRKIVSITFNGVDHQGASVTMKR